MVYVEEWPRKVDTLQDLSVERLEELVAQAKVELENEHTFIDSAQGELAFFEAALACKKANVHRTSPLVLEAEKLYNHIMVYKMPASHGAAMKRAAALMLMHLVEEE